MGDRGKKVAIFLIFTMLYIGLSGCAPTMTVVALSEVGSVMATGKSLSAHAASSVVGLDCSWVRADRDGGALCRSKGYGMLVEEPYECHKTLGEVECYVQKRSLKIENENTPAHHRKKGYEKKGKGDLQKDHSQVDQADSAKGDGSQVDQADSAKRDGSQVDQADSAKRDSSQVDQADSAKGDSSQVDQADSAKGDGSQVDQADSVKRDSSQVDQADSAKGDSPQVDQADSAKRDGSQVDKADSVKEGFSKITKKKKRS